MQSNKEIAKKIVKENPEVFESLMEFERIKKISSKERALFSIDKTLLNQFRKYCKKNGMKMSSVIENYIQQIIK